MNHLLTKFISLSILSLFCQSAMAELEDCQNPYVLKIKGDVTMRFCEIPAASGVKIGSMSGNKNEQPVVTRNFTKNFHIAQFEITREQFKAILGYEPWRFANGKLKPYVEEGEQLPAVYITYSDGLKIAEALSNVEKGVIYRLPTESEWEYAASGGKRSSYHWGEQYEPHFAFTYENSRMRHFDYVGEVHWGPREVTKCPIPFLNRSRPGYCANQFGLMHMLGNVWETTLDEYESEWVNNYEGSRYNYSFASNNGHRAFNDGFGDDERKSRVIRGGSFDKEKIDARISRRASTLNHYSDDFSNRGFYYIEGYEVGFRLVRIKE